MRLHVLFIDISSLEPLKSEVIVENFYLSISYWFFNRGICFPIRVLITTGICTRSKEIRNKYSFSTDFSNNLLHSAIKLHSITCID